MAQPLPARRTLTGNVFDAAGNPLPGVFVYLQRTDKKATAAYWGGMAQTDVKGRFLFEDAEFGAYRISGKGQDFFDYSNVENIGDVDYSWDEQASPARLVLHNQPVKLTLQLQQKCGTPVANTLLFMMCRKSVSTHRNYRYQQFTTNARGEVKLWIPPQCTLFISAPQTGWAALTAVDFKAGTEATTTALLQEGGALSAFAFEETPDGEKVPVKGARPRITTAGDQDPLQDIAHLLHKQVYETSLDTYATGWFALRNIKPGSYQISFNHPDYEESLPSIVQVEKDGNTTCEILLRRKNRIR
jgi:5-hydroxyisourate hydrolase-like protein (transthyretin family)